MNAPSNLEGTPEERIIHEIYLTNKGGTPPGNNPTAYSRVFESVLLRELRLIARNVETDMRFAQGYVVEEYGTDTPKGIDLTDVPTIDSDGPRFDIVCYTGNVVWKTFDGVSHAVVPASRTRGVIEAKRTLSPGYFPVDSSREMNLQFRRQQDYLEAVGADVPFIVLGAHYSGSKAENRESADADRVALLGELSKSDTSSPESAVMMAQEGELEAVVKLVSE